MPNKTKAALQGRSCQSIKLKPGKIITLNDQVKLTPPLAEFGLVCVLTEGGILPFEQNQTVIDISSGVGGVSPTVTAPLAQFDRISDGIPPMGTEGYPALAYTPGGNHSAKIFVQWVLEDIHSPKNLGQPFGSFLAFWRWRRLISPCMAKDINCPVLSPGSFTCSMPSMISCAIRAVIDCDLAFFGPVAISTPFDFWCKTIYTKFLLLKGLTCKTLRAYLVSYTVSRSGCENSEAPQVVATPAELLTKPLYEVTIMANVQSKQNPHEFTWSFRASQVKYPNAREIILHVTATSEEEIRSAYAGWNLTLIARRPAWVKEMYHV